MVTQFCLNLTEAKFIDNLGQINANTFPEHNHRPSNIVFVFYITVWDHLSVSKRQRR